MSVNLTSEIGKDLPAYLDNMATTPLDPRVLDSMLPYLSNNFGKSSTHFRKKFDKINRDSQLCAVYGGQNYKQ